MDNTASDGSTGGNGSTTSGGVGGESGNRMTSGGNGSGRQREVKTEEGEAFAKENDLLFVEASAKSGENVEHAFFTASKDILDKVKRGVFDQGKVSFFVFFFLFINYCFFKFSIFLSLFSLCLSLRSIFDLRNELI